MADPYGGQKPGCIDPDDPLGCFSSTKMLLLVALAVLGIAIWRRKA